MKKLMTIFASAATLCAVGVAKGELTTTGFEAAPYVAGQALDTAKDDAGRTSVDGGFAPTWAETELEDGVAVVTAYGGEGAAVAADVASATGVAVDKLGSNYLKLDGAPLISRYVAVQDEYNPVDPQIKSVDIGDGLYIDTLVQFTAADPETPPETTEGDKLCIWLAENTEDATQCTLMVGAGFVNDDSGLDIVATNYTTTTTLANNSWHRLQVKILPSIDGDMLSDGFVVFIDGTAVATATCPINEAFVGDYELNARAQKYMTEDSYSLFPSLVGRGGAGDGTITSLSFSGSGAVDNLAFTQDADIDPILIPQALEPVVNGAKFTYTGSDIEAVSYPDDAYGYEFADESNFGTEVGDYRTTATLFPGYAWIDGSTANKTYDWSIVEGGDTGGFDGGDGSAFSIDAATQSALEAVLPAGKKLTDTADAASGMTYAQAYALGLLNDETGDVEPLEATIEFVDGKVKVSLNDATATTKYVVTLKVYEKSSLTAEWPTTPKLSYELGSSAEAAGFTPGSETAGFYKVQVVIGDGTSN